jgi:hypothetical protein
MVDSDLESPVAGLPVAARMPVTLSGITSSSSAAAELGARRAATSSPVTVPQLRSMPVCQCAMCHVHRGCLALAASLAPTSWHTKH